MIYYKADSRDKRGSKLQPRKEGSKLQPITNENTCQGQIWIQSRSMKALANVCRLSLWPMGFSTVKLIHVRAVIGNVEQYALTNEGVKLIHVRAIVGNELKPIIS